MDVDGGDEDLVTPSSDIGELRPQDSTGAAAAVADVSSFSARRESDGDDSDSEELLIGRISKPRTKRKGVKSAAKAANVKSCTPTAANAETTGDVEPGVEKGPNDPVPDAGDGAAASELCEDEDIVTAVAGGDAGDRKTPDTNSVSPNDLQEALGGMEVSHASRPLTPTMASTPMSLHTPRTPATMVPGDGGLHSPASSSSEQWLVTPRSLTAACEVVDMSTHDVGDDVETADEAEVDITTQVDADPNALPPIDAELLRDLERRAHYVSDDLTHLLGTMTTNLHAMSSVSLRCMESYRESIDDLGVNVDEGIKSMYMLIAKCESISNDMKPIYNLADQIRSIKRTLALFEQLCKS